MKNQTVRQSWVWVDKEVVFDTEKFVSRMDEQTLFRNSGFKGARGGGRSTGSGLLFCPRCVHFNPREG